MEPISITLDVTKIDKSALFKGAKGTYLTIVVWPNKDGKDQYGYDATVKQDLGKDRREEKTPFIGNAKIIKRKNATPPPTPPPNYGKLPTAAEMEDEDFIPF
jgi:hypothetical protein